MDASLGQVVRAARQQAGLTLEDVADRVGVTVGALSHIESGRRLPSAPNAMLIAEVLGIPAEEMLDALDREHSLKRESIARQSLQSRGLTRESERRSANRADRVDATYTRRPIEDLFAPPAPAPRAGALFAVSGAADARNSARWSPDTSERIEALDRLADTAAEAIRTLRGMLGDEDPMVAREARRLLRELDVRMPEE